MMTANCTCPVRRAGPSLTVISILVALFSLVNAGVLYGGAPVVENESQISLDHGTAADELIAQEFVSEELVINLLFHFEQQDGSSAGYTREFAATVVEALNEYYRPRGVVFQYETSCVSVLDMAGAGEVTEASEQSVTSGVSTESEFTIYLLDASGKRLGAVAEPPAINCAVINVGERTALEPSRLVLDLGKNIALWHTLQDADWLSEIEDGIASGKVLKGDINGDGRGPDISDLVYMVNFIFKGGPVPTILQAADIANPVGTVDIGDLVYLVDIMFSTE